MISIAEMPRVRAKYAAVLAIDIFVSDALSPLIFDKWFQQWRFIKCEITRLTSSLMQFCQSQSVVNGLSNITVAKASLLSNRFLTLGLGSTNRYRVTTRVFVNQLLYNKTL